MQIIQKKPYQIGAAPNPAQGQAQASPWLQLGVWSEYFVVDALVCHTQANKLVLYKFHKAAGAAKVKVAGGERQGFPERSQFHQPMEAALLFGRGIPGEAV